MSVRIGIYDEQLQITQESFVVVADPTVIRNPEVCTGAVSNDIAYEAEKECHREADSEHLAPEAMTVIEVNKRRSEYLPNASVSQFTQEAGCSAPKITRTSDCLESSPEHLLAEQNDRVYQDNEAELIVDNDAEHQTIHDISRYTPREIDYEAQHCNVQPQNCNIQSQQCNVQQQRCKLQQQGCKIQSQHCNLQPQHCDVQSQACNVEELPLSRQRVDNETLPMEKNNVKNEVDSDETGSDLLISLNNVLNPGEVESFDRYRPKGRPRGPKHPVWNFYKFCKSGGLTLGYMCLMCGGGFTGPPNTTNATKHLRCKHKHEYLLYFDLLEGAKQGTFFGDVHQSIRELILKRGVKAEVSSTETVSNVESRAVYDDASESSLRNRHYWVDDVAVGSQDAELHSLLSSALMSNNSKNSLIRYDVNSANENSEVSSSGEVIFAGSSNGDTETNSSNVSTDSMGQFAGQVESFLRDYRRLEAECRRLRTEAAAKDEQIKSLRINLLEERNKRKSALILVQRALLDE